MIDDFVVIVKKNEYLSRNTLCSADINNVCKQARQNIYRFASLICYVKKYMTHIALKLEFHYQSKECVPNDFALPLMVS